jgi:hypothetical protein
MIHCCRAVRLDLDGFGVEMRKSLLLLFIACLISLLAACNLPLQSTPVEEQSPEAIYTAAAETISARLAQTELAAPITLPSETSILPVEQPSNTTAPSNTPEPTNTPESTLTPTPSETPTPTENPEAIFTDDFSDTSGWYKYQEDDYGFLYADDGYHIYNNVLGAAYWSILAREYTRVGLEVDGTRLAGPDDGYYGVVCRFADDGDNYYALVISDNGFYGIAMMEDGEFDFLDTGTDEAGIIHRGMESTNRVRGDCAGNRLVLYANGQQLLETWDDTFSTGDIGLIAGNRLSGDGVDVLFDNFAILQP